MKRRTVFVLFFLATFLTCTLAVYAGGHAESGSAASSAQASAVNLSGNSAQRAVEAAKKYAGQTVTLSYEAGLQAVNPLAMAKIWYKDTGVHLKVIQLPNGQLYTKAVNAHVGGGQIADVMLTDPGWVPDFISSGVIVKDLGPYISKYANPTDIAKLPKDYRPLIKYNGKQIGFLTDGDDWIMYYRKDWFSNPTYQSAFKAQYGYDLAPPKTVAQFNNIADFFTKEGNGKFYGYTAMNAPGQVFNYFNQFYGALGGRYFDPNTMKPLINGPIGVQTLKEIVYLLRDEPPGAAKFDFVQGFVPFVTGKAAMLIDWAPIGKFAGGMASGHKSLSFVPESKVAGDVGYAVPPGGHSQFAQGLELTISADSPHKTLAYLFAQWYTSPQIHMKWIQLPTSLGKPTYTNEFTNPQILNLFPGAKQWVAAIEAGSNNPHPDTNMPGEFAYEAAIDNAGTAAIAGTPAQQALNQAAAKWEQVTKQHGVQSQMAYYKSNLMPFELRGLGPKEPNVP